MVDPSADLAGFTKAGLDVGTFKPDQAALRQAQYLLLEVEKLDRVQRQVQLEEMEEADWQLYRAVRYSRDKMLA